MSLDFYNAVKTFFDAFVGVPYGQTGIIPGSIENFNGISSHLEIF